MPAVDPTRLARELDGLADLVHDPEETIRACLDLLDFYADRTRRPKLAEAADLTRRFGVPGPVLRQLSHRLAQSAHGLSDAGDDLADALWAAGIRETRLAAAAVFEPRQDDRVPMWVEERARDCGDQIVLKALGGQSLKSWGVSHPGAFLEYVWTWMDAPEPRLIGLAMIALGEAISRPEFPLGPSLFQGLENRIEQLAVQPRRALEDLLRRLAGRSPAETAQMLKVRLRQPGSHGALTPVLKSALPYFPDRQRKFLEAALSEQVPD